MWNNFNVWNKAAIANLNVGILKNKRAGRREGSERQQGQKALCSSVDEYQYKERREKISKIEGPGERNALSSVPAA